MLLGLRTRRTLEPKPAWHPRFPCRNGRLRTQALGLRVLGFKVWGIGVPVGLLGNRAGFWGSKLDDVGRTAVVKGFEGSLSLDL